jgi:hypothetical protein
MGQDRDNQSENSNRLVDAVRQAKIVAADKSDVVVEMREADRTRLELLAQDLQPVISEVPREDDRFDFALSAGLQPRFWIDATAHVAMAPDRRTYRFVRDTRLGRILLAETPNRADVADQVTRYIATRMHERELAYAGEAVSYRDLATGRSDDVAKRADMQDPDGRIEQAAAVLKSEAPQPKAQPRPTPDRPAAPAIERGSSLETFEPGTRSVISGLFWVLLGVAIGAGGILLRYADRIF